MGGAEGVRGCVWFCLGRGVVSWCVYRKCVCGFDDDLILGIWMVGLAMDCVVRFGHGRFFFYSLQECGLHGVCGNMFKKVMARCAPHVFGIHIVQGTLILQSDVLGSVVVRYNAVEV